MLGAVGAAVFLPFQLAAAVAIRLEDGGPVLFRQERVGRHRAPFRIAKLRTMRDGNTTPVGRWLRATGLDETTQFLHVLRGEMSVVGPRPLTEADLVRLGWTEHRARFEVRPGITGLAQVFGGRSARHSRALDALYARRTSVRLDVWLVAVSFAMNVFGKDRVRQRLRRRARSRRSLDRSPAGPRRSPARGISLPRERSKRA